MVAVPLARQQTLTRPQSTARLAMDDGAGRALQSGLGAIKGELNAWRDSLDEGIARDADLELNSELTDILSGEDGYLRKRGRAGAEGLDDTRERLEDAHRRAMEGLTPGARRRMGGVANNRLIRAVQGATDHAVRERDAWIVQAAQARQGRALQDAIAARHDPAEVAAHITLGFQELDKEAETMGWAAPFLAEKKAAYASTVHVGIAESLAITDPRAGLAYLDAHKDDILETDELGLRKAFHDDAMRRDGADFARGAFAGAYESKALHAALRGGKWDAAAAVLRSAVIYAESRGRSVLGPVTREGGGREAQAHGVMQVMPGTARSIAKDLGLWDGKTPFDLERLLNDKEYNTRIGTEYLSRQLRDYHGVVELALAAYNAGPGKVDEWLKRFGDPRKGEISAAEWAAKIPFKETREYVAGIMGNVLDRDPWAEAMAIEDPDARAAALTEVRALEAGTARRNKRDAEALNAEAFALIEGGTAVDELPYAMRVRLGVSMVNTLRNYASKKAEGVPIENDDEVAYTLDLMSTGTAAERAKFAGIDLINYRDKLDDANFNRIRNIQMALRKDKHTRVTYAGADGAIRDIAPGLYDFNAKPDTTAGKKLRNLREPLWRDIDAFIEREGRAPDTPELHDMVRRLLAKVPDDSASLFGHATDFAARVALGPIAGGLFGDEILGDDATALDPFSGGERTVGEAENEAFNAAGAPTAAVAPGAPAAAPPSERTARIMAAFKMGVAYNLKPEAGGGDDYVITPETLAYVEKVFTKQHERAPESVDELVDWYLGVVDAGRARAAAAEPNRIPEKYRHKGPGGPERFPLDLSDPPDPPLPPLPRTGQAAAKPGSDR